jgi:hypothetical protein
MVGSAKPVIEGLQFRPLPTKKIENPEQRE